MSHAPNNSPAPSVEPSSDQQGQPRALALAAGSAFWESPALKLRSRHYPEHFEDRVPLTIRMRYNVRPDPWCDAIGGKPGTILRGGEVYPAWTNSHGAVCGICANGERLGVRPDEFEVEEWYAPNTKLTGANSTEA